MQILFTFSLHSVEADSNDAFAQLWRSTWRNITIPIPVPIVRGTMPLWLNGALIRNAGGGFESKKRNVTFAFDGLPKLFKFSISEGAVHYQERFLEDRFFDFWQENQDFPKVNMMGATRPPQAFLSKPNPSLGDIDNIEVFKLRGDDEILALTDSTFVGSFRMGTLEFQGLLPTNDGAKSGAIQLSCAHPQYRPGTEGRELVNFVSSLLSWPGEHELIAYRMGSDHVRVPFGTTRIHYAP